MISTLEYLVLLACVTFLDPFKNLFPQALTPKQNGTCLDPQRGPKPLTNLKCNTGAGAVKFRCDYKYSNIGWFKYHATPATWADARLMCQLEGAMLASPTTPNIKSAMLQSNGKNDIFTGIQATFFGGHFFTIDGIPLEKFPHQWAEFEPKSMLNVNRCLTLNCEGKLLNVRCDEPRPYVCFRKHSNLDVNICGTIDKEYHFDSRTNKCYKFHTDIQTFERAHFACSAEGGHLAIINSEVESKVLSELFIRYEPRVIYENQRAWAFIGIHNWGEGGDWRTVEGQSLQEAGYDKFAQGQPNNATTGQYCGSIFASGRLNDLWCEDYYPFICEKSHNYPPVCDST